MGSGAEGLCEKYTTRMLSPQRELSRADPGYRGSSLAFVPSLLALADRRRLGTLT